MLGAARKTVNPLDGWWFESGTMLCSRLGLDWGGPVAGREEKSRGIAEDLTVC